MTVDNGLRVQWSGGDQTFAPGTSVVIGRDVGLEVTSDNPTVSRRHAELTFDGTVWVLRDLDSTQGTYVDGRRVAMYTIGGATALVVGDPRTGETLSLTVAANESTAMNRPASAPSSGPSGSASPGTVVVGGPERPGGRLQENQLNGATVVTGQTVNIECGGRTYSFEPGSTITVGRDEHCDVVVANPTVSRRHARLTYDSGGWTVVDEGSSSGMFIDGRRVDEAKLSGTTAVFLGGQEAGERMVIVTSGATRSTSVTGRGGSRVLLGVAAAAVVIVVVALGAWFVLGGGGPDDNQLAQATVLIVGDQASGSGSIIDSEEGLILTNAHVADPKAPGMAVQYGSPASQEDDPGELRIYVAPGLDKAAEPKYIAEVVASDGYLDLAVLKITKTGRGALIEDGDLDGLVEVEVGDSEKVKSGSDVSVFGYPGAAESSAVSLTRGVVSAGVQDNRLSDNRAFFNIDAEINPGNSGGLAADDDGLLIGVPTLIRGVSEANPVSSIRPVNYAKPLIEQARTGRKAKSPSHLRKLKDESIDPDTISFATLGNEAGIDFNACDTGSVAAGDSAIAFTFDYEGFKAGEHQDFMIWVYNSDNETVGEWSAKGAYPLKWPESGCATVSLPLVKDLAVGSYGARIFLGPDYESVVDVGFDVT